MLASDSEYRNSTNFKLLKYSYLMCPYFELINFICFQGAIYLQFCLVCNCRATFSNHPNGLTVDLNLIRVAPSYMIDD